MSKDQNQISENTGIKISLVITIITASIFLGHTFQRVAANEKDVKKLEKKMEVLHQIDKRLSRIEGALGVKPNEN